MTIYRIAVYPRQAVSDPHPLRAASQLHLRGLTGCYSARLFFLETELPLSEIEALAHAMLADPVTERFSIDHPFSESGLIEVTYLPGVTDPIADNLLRSAQLSGMSIKRAATGQSYRLSGDLDRETLIRLATEVLSNPLIQRHSIGAPISPPFVAYQAADDTVEIIPIRALSEADLLSLSQTRRLSLDAAEMTAIRDYYQTIDRDPTDAELEMLAQTWSEHCVHKTFKAAIRYHGPAHGDDPYSTPTEQQINGLLKTYIRAATDQLAKPWVRSAFVDNAGIIEFNDDWDLAFKVETHNRPSALEPFGGANTGVGGVIRDVLGVSARPIANTDVLCFGLPDTVVEDLPQGVLHPTRIADGVIAGIEDYGNKMGIPTVNGSITYHPGYTSNPLVFCGCIGILPHGSHRSTAQAGDLIVVIGGKTGRDGLRGATFSSMEMDTQSALLSGGAVQIGHPIAEKQVQEVVLRARDAGLYNAITDCGAGGLSSAVGEMGADLGARVYLERVPLKYPGLRPWEIWLSEAQERMVFAVRPAQWEAFQAIAQGQDVIAVAIGTFEPTGRLELFYEDHRVGDLSMRFLHDGIPQRQLRAEWSPTRPAHSSARPIDEDFNQTLLHLLAMPTLQSKESVIRKYDHEVQTGTALKPLVGVDAAGPSDAAVLLPLDVIDPVMPHQRAVAVSNAICPTYGEIDPYAMAWAAIDEAFRNLSAVGADPDRIAILDNFSWGNTQLPDRLGALVRCCQGCHDAAIAYGAPFISGKDSLNNEYLGADGQRHAIPGTLVISAIGIVPNVAKTVSMELKAAGNRLYVIGTTDDELGGSHYHLYHGLSGGIVPQPHPHAIDSLRALHRAISGGLVSACHDVSEGGLAVAIAEMAIGGRLGANLTLSSGDPVVELFSESTSRLIVEVAPEHATAFEALFTGLPLTAIGIVEREATLTIGEQVRLPIAQLERAWRGHSGIAHPTPKPNDSARETLLINAVNLDLGHPKVLILHANGTNRDRDAALACQLAGGEPEIVHVNQLIHGTRRLSDYAMLVIPGGFSYGDDLGAGVLWSLDLRERLPYLDRFVAEGRPVLGICNGFQTLVKAGLLPGRIWDDEPRSVTLTYNAQGHFECRWVYLRPNPLSPSLFTDNLPDLIHCPIAHGEGRIATRDEAVLARLLSDHLDALTYVDANGQVIADYPINPNGSAANIAGLTNPAGNVFGLMPHPENHIFPWQNPRRHRGSKGMLGLRLFENGIKRC
ncbi:MAG: phosphoribosylformylglycinamidine synthase subunit PurL [Anaerolineae bacterium]|nr:phosphoribosylformylglycinamidine synthase subunit PurL [Anaerolineae bacterium]